MHLPGFSAEAALYRADISYQVILSSGHGGGERVVAALQWCTPCSPYTPCSTRGHQICCRDSGLGTICGDNYWCTPPPAIQVSWVPFGNGVAGLVIAKGCNFTANSQVQGEVTNCLGPYPRRISATTDASGEFTTWAECNCSGVTSVSACDGNGNCGQGTANIPC
jgi:hypothetical protein